MRNPRYPKKLKKMLEEMGVSLALKIRNLSDLKGENGMRDFFQDMERHRRYRRLAEVMVTYPRWTVTTIMGITLSLIHISEPTRPY